MQNYIEDWANNRFYESESVNFGFEEIDFHELHNFVDELDLSQSSWNLEELMVQPIKSYDADGNSEYLGVLTLSSLNKEAKDFLELAPYFDELYFREDHEGFYE